MWAAHVRLSAMQPSLRWIHKLRFSISNVFLLATTTKEFGKVRGRCRDDAVAVVMLHRRRREWREHQLIRNLYGAYLLLPVHHIMMSHGITLHKQ